MKTLIPEDLATITPEELFALEATIVAEFDELSDAGSTDIPVITEIADALDSVRAEIVSREEAATLAASQVAELAARIRPAVAETIVEPATEVTEPVAPIVAEPVIVAAAPKVAPKAPSARAVRAVASTPDAPKANPSIVITAAADVQGFTAGRSLDALELAKAVNAKAYTLSNGSGRVSVASINVPLEHKLGDGFSVAENIDTIERMTAPSALTAAGWCAPSNNMYELFGIEGTDGIIDLPTAQITRGGVNIPGFISFGDAVDADALWTWSEDSPESSETKVCAYIPCPTFQDYRLVAEGLCLTNGNLTDRAFPELTQRFISVVYSAHIHRVGTAVVNKIVATAVPVTMDVIASTSAAGRLLHAVDVQVADYRSQYRMPVASMLEAIFPLWTKELVRADLAMRNGVALLAVTDAEVMAYFAVRKVRAQFVHDYIPMYSGATPKTAFPTTIKFLLYPAGGYFKGDGGVIDLGVIRDSVLNATNDYTAAWTEQMYLVGQVGPDAREVTVAYTVDGKTGT